MSQSDLQSDLADPAERSGAAALWPALLSLSPASPEATRHDDTMRKAAAVVSPALLGVLADPASVAGIEAAEIRQSRLLNRFTRTTGLRWARHAGASGVSVVAIKGLATAHALYADPDTRPMSDADLLVRASDLHRLLAVLGEAGLRFRAATAASRWGFVSDASFQALTSADESVNIDLHVHPDAWPFHRAVSTDDVFAEAVELELRDGSLRVPCPLHMLAITLSHAARDRFQIETAKSLIDAALLLRLHGGRLDWDRFQAICRKARMTGPARAFFALIGALGGDVMIVPEPLRRRPATAEFDRALSDFLNFRSTIDEGWPRLRREALLATQPSVLLSRMATRLKGLVRPNSGLPD